jgi:hypothetical protein
MSSIDGKWLCFSSSPMGEQKTVLELKSDGEAVTGTATTDMETVTITEGRFDGSQFTWKMKITEPFSMSMSGDVAITGDNLAGGMSVGFLGKTDIRGTRQAG